MQGVQLHSTTNTTSLVVAPPPPPLLPTVPPITARQFMKENPGSKASFGTGPDRKFDHLFVAMKSVVDLLAEVGLGQFLYGRNSPEA